MHLGRHVEPHLQRRREPGGSALHELSQARGGRYHYRSLERNLFLFVLLSFIQIRIRIKKYPVLGSEQIPEFDRYPQICTVIWRIRIGNVA